MCLYLNLMLFCVAEFKEEESSDDDMGYGLFGNVELVEDGQTLNFARVRRSHQQ